MSSHSALKNHLFTGRSQEKLKGRSFSFPLFSQGYFFKIDQARASNWSVHSPGPDPQAYPTIRPPSLPSGFNLSTVGYPWISYRSSKASPAGFELDISIRNSINPLFNAQKPNIHNNHLSKRMSIPWGATRTVATPRTLTRNGDVQR